MYTITDMYGLNKRYEIVKEQLKVTMLMKGVQTITDEVHTQDASVMTDLKQFTEQAIQVVPEVIPAPAVVIKIETND